MTLTVNDKALYCGYTVTVHYFDKPIWCDPMSLEQCTCVA